MYQSAQLTQVFVQNQQISFNSAKLSLVSSTQTAFRSPNYPSGNAYYNNNLDENQELTQSGMRHHLILSPKPSYKILQDRNRDLERELAVQKYFQYLLMHIC